MNYDDYFCADTLIKRVHKGINLVPSGRLSRKHGRQSTSVHSVNDLMQMPFNVYLLDTEHTIQAINTPALQSCGFQSMNDAIGHTIARVCYDHKMVDKLFKHDHQVIEAKKPFLFDEQVDRGDKGILHAVSLRMPVLSDDDTIIGIFGCSAVLSDNNIHHAGEHLAQITNMFLSAQTQPSNNTNNIPKRVIPLMNYLLLGQAARLRDDPDIQRHELHGLISKLSQKYNTKVTAREMECLFFLLQGKSARETGRYLHLSSRTVESYLGTLKEKMHCNKKSELIELVLNLIE